MQYLVICMNSVGPVCLYEAEREVMKEARLC